MRVAHKGTFSHSNASDIGNGTKAEYKVTLHIYNKGAAPLNAEISITPDHCAAYQILNSSGAIPPSKLL